MFGIKLNIDPAMPVAELQTAMMKKASLSSVMLVAVWVAGSQAIAANQQQRFEDLIAAAEAVIAVEILSTDYSATPADGPMVAEAKVLKALKGPLAAGQQFRFTESAWVGPNYQKGEPRILFLEKTRPREFPKATEWRVLSNLHARTDFFFEKDSLSDLSLESLESFLKKVQELKDRPKKVVFSKSTMK